MCVHTCICIYMYVTYVYVYLYTYVSIHMFVYTYIYRSISIYRCTNIIECIYIYVYIHIWRYMYTYMCACMYVRTYVRTYVCMYVCMHIYIYTHTELTAAHLNGQQPRTRFHPKPSGDPRTAPGSCVLYSKEASRGRGDVGLFLSSFGFLLG